MLPQLLNEQTRHARMDKYVLHLHDLFHHIIASFSISLLYLLHHSMDL